MSNQSQRYQAKLINILTMDLIYNDQSYQNVLNTQISVRYQCRICLVQLEEQSRQICGCRGGLRSIHQKCLIEWFKRTATSEQLSNKTKTCQICTWQIHLDVSKNYSCNNLISIIEDNICKNHCDIDTKLALVLCLFFVPLIIMVGSLVSFVSNTQEKRELQYLVICMAILSSIGLFCIVKCYCIRENYELKGIKQKKISYFETRNRKVSPYIV